jgi:hypothetical protein
MKPIFLSCILVMSTIFVSAQDDCYEKFFATAQKPVTTKTQVTRDDGKTVLLSAFLKEHSSPEMEMKALSGLADLDKDGKKELVVYGYSGGAHCCDEFYFFSNSAPNQYKFAGKTFGGDVCVSKNDFLFSFDEQFGYFFTCYACSLEDNSDVKLSPMHNIVLNYVQGKLQVASPDDHLRSTVEQNLGKLSKESYVKLEDESDQDNGLRKEFAMNLAVYYFSFGKDMLSTQTLFNKYYKFADAKKVWTAFVKQIQYMATINSF